MQYSIVFAGAVCQNSQLLMAQT